MARSRGFDLAVIGGGAAGLAAAREGRRRGARTLLVQDGPVGGECTFTGCVPSKTLIESAAKGLGFTETMGRVRRAVATIAATESAEVIRREGIEVVETRARLGGPRRVDVGGNVVTARRIVVATGSRPAVPPIAGLDRADALTTDTVFDLVAPPRSLAILGGGPVGCELAQGFARLGVRVVLVEALPRLLPTEEPEVSEVIERAMHRAGVEVLTGAPAKAVERTSAGVRIHVTGAGAAEAEQLLVAVGRAPNTGGLGLELAGVQTDAHGAIPVDDALRTSEPSVYAAGDVTALMPFTHVADEMGRLAAANALSRGRRQRFRTDAIPWAVFTDPEVARVGLSEREAAPRGGRVAYVPLSELDRAITAGETDGFVKLIAGPRRLLGNAGGGRVLGATIVAPRAGELVHEAALAIRTRTFAGRLAQTVHAYPTWSVAMRIAASQLFDGYGPRSARPAEAD